MVYTLPFRKFQKRKMNRENLKTIKLFISEMAENDIDKKLMLETVIEVGKYIKDLERKLKKAEDKAEHLKIYHILK